MVLATQAYTSLHGSLDRRYADVLMLNLSNELIFTCANHDSALIASKNIGEREVVEKTWGWAAGKPTSNYQRVIKPYFPAFKLRKLPKFTAIVRHCERPFRKRLIPPINPDGSYPKWFTRLRPDYALRQWLKCARIQTREPFMNAQSDRSSDDLNGLEAHLLSRIKGQDHVIPRVCSVLERGQLGLAAHRETARFVPVSRTDRRREDGTDSRIHPLSLRERESSSASTCRNSCTWTA